MKRGFLVLLTLTFLPKLGCLPLIDDYDQGLEIAEAYQMPLLLVFGDEIALQTIQGIRNEFIVVRVNDSKLRERYLVDQDPYFVLIDSTQEEIAKVPFVPLVDEEYDELLRQEIRNHALKTFST